MRTFKILFSIFTLLAFASLVSAAPNPGHEGREIQGKLDIVVNGEPYAINATNLGTPTYGILAGSGVGAYGSGLIGVYGTGPTYAGFFDGNMRVSGSGDFVGYSYFHNGVTIRNFLDLPLVDFFYMNGTFGVGPAFPHSGNGVKLFFLPKKAAFRAGSVGGNQWDEANLGDYSVALGVNSLASATAAVVGGGDSNSVTNDYSVVSGGRMNTINSDYGMIGGGLQNTVLGRYSTIAGGWRNDISGDYSSIAGGLNNTITQDRASIVGGSHNRAEAVLATVGGGQYNVAGGSASWVGGRNMQLTATAGQSFVWGVSDTPQTITRNRVFLMFPKGDAGQVGIMTDNPSVELDVVGAIHSTGDICTDAAGGKCLSTAGGGSGSVWNTTTDTIYTMTNVSIGTSTSRMKLTVSDDGGIVATGTVGSGKVLSPIAEDAQFVFYPRRGAIRGGADDGTNWDDSKIGNYSVAFGRSTEASGLYSTVSGGTSSDASGQQSVVGGGNLNIASGYSSTISGGTQNTAEGFAATIGGGASNLNNNTIATIGGGSQNTVTGYGATIGGGKENSAGNDYSTISGGNNNTISASYATISGGINNIASGLRSAISGGYDNIASADTTTVSGGHFNNATDTGASVGGGVANLADGLHATVGGGMYNRVLYQEGTVSGGFKNAVLGNEGTVGGGLSNTAGTGQGATVAGGYYNKAYGTNSFVGGGFTNNATGDYSVVSGGAYNEAGGDYSWAGGRNIQIAPGADHTFAWGYSVTNPVTITGSNRFLIYPAGTLGRVGIRTPTPAQDLEVNGSFGSRSAYIGYDTNAFLMPIQAINRDTGSGAAVSVNVEAFDSSGRFVAYSDNFNPATSLTDSVVLMSETDASGGLVLYGQSAPIRFMTPSFTDERMRITSTGNVGIGESNPIYPLDMGSGAHVTAGGVWTDASSREYKTAIQELSSRDALDVFNELNPVTFRYNKEPGELHAGFIAEDSPDLITSGDKKGVAAMDVVAVLTKVVQQQQVEIDELKQRLSQLEEAKK